MPLQVRDETLLSLQRPFELCAKNLVQDNRVLRSDLIQAANVAALEAFPRWDNAGRSSLKSWMQLRGYGAMVDYLRRMTSFDRERRHAPQVLSLDATARRPWQIRSLRPDPEKLVILRERRDVPLRYLVAGRSREIVRALLRGVSRREVCGRFGISEGRLSQVVMELLQPGGVFTALRKNGPEIMRRLAKPLVTLSLAASIASAQTATAWVFYCDTTPTAAALNCRLVKLGASISLVNGVLTAAPTAQKPARKYGQRLTCGPESAWTGIPVGAANVSLFVNGLQQYQDRGDFKVDPVTGAVTLAYSDDTWEVRADYDPVQ